MTCTPTRTALRFALAVALAALSAGAFAASGHADGQSGYERLVVRGDATIADGPCGPGGCSLEIKDGSFRGTPVGTGAYEGSTTLRVAELFENGEGGLCAPFSTRIVLGTGTPDRLVLSVAGDSCQDGTGPVTEASFTGVAQFVVKKGTGKYAGAHGFGLATFVEDAADHDRMTLVGRIRL